MDSHILFASQSMLQPCQGLQRISRVTCFFKATENNVPFS
jgi:hypothetical protein